MEAGKYYVGDLCYVLPERWDEVCDLIIKDRVCLEGEFELSDGIKFAMYSTAYGDGHYYDQNGGGYSVDSGSIGCVLWDRIDPKYEISAMRLGILVDIDESFDTSAEDGMIMIGDIVIDTIGENPDEEEDDDY